VPERKLTNSIQKILPVYFQCANLLKKKIIAKNHYFIVPRR